MVTAIVVRSAVEYRSDSTDGHELPIERSGQVIAISAGEDVVGPHQRESAPMAMAQAVLA